MTEMFSKLWARAETTEDADGIHVMTWWSGLPLDRPCTGGWALGVANAKNRKLAERLARAINAQKAHADPVVATDVNGKRYVNARALVWGRRMNADLKRLGY